jgi:hypothetical protein
VVALRCTQVVRERLHLPKDLPEPPALDQSLAENEQDTVY